jgi:hypothetical protein
MIIENSRNFHDKNECANFLQFSNQNSIIGREQFHGNVSPKSCGKVHRHSCPNATSKISLQWENISCANKETQTIRTRKKKIDYDIQTKSSRSSFHSKIVFIDIYDGLSDSKPRGASRFSKSERSCNTKPPSYCDKRAT